jgi:hypothetical protein
MGDERRKKGHLGKPYGPLEGAACGDSMVQQRGVAGTGYGRLVSKPVLTEDALSAFKISLAGFEAWPILGTSVPVAYIAEILKRGTGCVVWLDPDPPGRKAAARYSKQLRSYGVAVQNIVSERDPKLHFIDDIKGILRERDPEQHPSP